MNYEIRSKHKWGCEDCFNDLNAKLEVLEKRESKFNSNMATLESQVRELKSGLESICEFTHFDPIVQSVGFHMQAIAQRTLDNLTKEQK